MREVMGSYVVVAVGNASKHFRGMIKLNSTAADIWKLILEGLSESEICEKLFEQYDIDRERLEKDVRKTIEGFEKQGILENE